MSLNANHVRRMLTTSVLAGLISASAGPVGAETPSATAAAELIPSDSLEATVRPDAPNLATAVPANAHDERLARIRGAIKTAEERRQALRAVDAAVADPAKRKALAERWGVEVYGVRQATGGMMIDFRFRVLDAAKAEPLFDSRNKAYLVREGTDVRLPVPIGAKVGAFRPTNRGRNIVSDKDYYMMFANPGSYVQPGQKVSVVIGDFRVEGLALN